MASGQKENFIIKITIMLNFEKENCQLKIED